MMCKTNGEGVLHRHACYCCVKSITVTKTLLVASVNYRGERLLHTHAAFKASDPKVIATQEEDYCLMHKELSLLIIQYINS